VDCLEYAKDLGPDTSNADNLEASPINEGGNGTDLRTDAISTSDSVVVVVSGSVISCAELSAVAFGTEWSGT